MRAEAKFPSCRPGPALALRARRHVVAGDHPRPSSLLDFLHLILSLHTPLLSLSILYPATHIAMARKAAVKYRSLRSNLVHLPLSLYASLAQSQTVHPFSVRFPLTAQRPQGLILHLSPLVPASSSRQTPRPAYLGWSGLAAASSLSGIGGSQIETVEVDPEVALNYGWAEGTIVSSSVRRQLT